MGRRLLATGLTAAAILVCAASAGARPKLVGDDTLPLVSGNVTPLATLPVGHPIGARFRDHYMYVTGTDGLQIYDVSEPELPILTGELPLPHFENEDVDLGGDTLLISNDPSEGVGVLYVIDISNPALPLIEGAMVNGAGDGQADDVLGIFGVDPVETPLGTGIGHTSSCVKADCSFAYLAGTNRGITIVDLRDPASPQVAGHFKPAITGLATHDVQVDGEGLAWIVGADARPPDDVTDPVHAGTTSSGPTRSIVNSGQLGVPSLPDDPVFHFGDAVGGDGENPIDLIHHDSLRLGDVAAPGSRARAAPLRAAPRAGPLRTAAFAQVPGRPTRRVATRRSSA